MVDLTEWAWIFDTTFVVCRNVDNKVIIEIERTGNTRTGEMPDFPMELFGRIAGLGYDEKFFEKFVKSAADEFFRAYLRKT